LGIDVDGKMLLVALGYGRLKGMLDITARHSFVVFGTMYGDILTKFSASLAGSKASALPVYFYETG
jgi:hypothetical protein